MSHRKLYQSCSTQLW